MSHTKVGQLTDLNIRALAEHREPLGITHLGKTFVVFSDPPPEVLDEMRNIMDRIRAQHGGRHWEYRSLIAVRNKLTIGKNVTVKDD